MSSDDGHSLHDTSESARNTTTSHPMGSLSPNKTQKRTMNVVCSDLKEDKMPPDTELCVRRPIGLPVAYPTRMNQLHDEATPENIKNKYAKRAREVKDWTVGPMPEEPFLEHFLPYNPNTRPESGRSLISMTHETTASGSMDKEIKVEEPLSIPGPSAFDPINLSVQIEQGLYGPLVSNRNISGLVLLIFRIVLRSQ